MTIPKRTQEIIEEQLDAKTALFDVSTLPQLPTMTTVPMPEPTQTYNSGQHPGFNVQHDSINPPTPPVVETTDAKPDENKRTPILDERGNRPPFKGINFAIEIPRTYVDVPTSANPRNAAAGSSKLISLINKFIPTKTAEVDDNNLIIQEYIRNNHKISTSWE